MRAGPLGDADHIARGDAALVVGVECAVAASTCFCTSMGTGPEIDGDADIILSELDEGFVVRSGSAAGAAVVDRLELGPAESLQSDRAASTQVAAVRDRDRRSGPCSGACRPGCEPPSTTRAGPRSRTAASPAPTARSSARPASAPASRSPRTSTASRARPPARGTAASARASAGWPATPTSGRRSRTATGSGSPTSSRPGGTSSDRPAASVAVAASPGAPSGSTSARSSWRSRRSVRTRARSRGRSLHLRDGRRPRSRPSRPPATSRPPSSASTSRPSTRRRWSSPTDDPALLAAQPGQFVMVELPGFAVPPISISRIRPDGLDLTIRSAGPATARPERPDQRGAGVAARPARPRLAHRGRGRAATSSSSPAASGSRRYGR